MGASKFTLCVVLSVAALAACSGKSTKDYLEEAHAARSSGQSQLAERVLKEGLSRYPNDESLARGLAVLYKDTKKWEKLEQFLMLNPFTYDFTYWNEIASMQFEREDWEPAYYSYFHTGERAEDSYGDNACGFTAAEPYRNAAAAAFNMKSPNKLRDAAKKLISLDEKCSNVNEYVEEVKEWCNSVRVNCEE